MNVLAQEVTPVPSQPDISKENLCYLSADTLCHNDVYNHKEQKLGKLHSLMLRVPIGEVSFVIIAKGGFCGIGEKLLAVPWQALTLDRERKCFVLPMPEERLERAPCFDANSWPNMDDAVWVTEILSYYNVDHSKPDNDSKIEQKSKSSIQ
ncbi:PRC-barrel domain-containing protein [Aestuariibacter halophilus]|uniref:PRC-barrel domain-containing protein n=1 Tax=Fluctibacter halophilus TaxID=226011 RepID=A0ABS8GA23_9ALTE|nr:PRC-barrel domain-containing protein [Aestuariibacter halophilus]MCC2617299.1 PRC-barrel domain-containing protein [Aestuariibacter halophilus]